MDYLSRMKERLEGREAFVPHHLGRKEEVRKFADLVGVKTPKIYEAGTIHKILASDLPETFVLKPSFASTSIGIHVLESRESGLFDLLQDRPISHTEIIDEACNISERILGDASSGIFIIEELLRDHDGSFPPPDIRAYAFQGVIGMILVEHHIDGPARAMYFDGDFLPFADVDSRYSVADGMDHLEKIVEARTPRNWPEILNVAKRISHAVPSAFCRIDMYDAQNGINLGEITFLPGTFYYKNRKIMSQAESERLGRLWGEAETRLTGSHRSW